MMIGKCVLSFVVATSAFLSLCGEEPTLIPNQEIGNQGHVLNFNDVSVSEFVRFVSRIAQVNFIFDEKILDFNMTLVSGQPTPTKEILDALFQLLNQHGIKVSKKENYYLIEKMNERERALQHFSEAKKIQEENKDAFYLDLGKDISPEGFFKKAPEPEEFFVYKLQYHKGFEIQTAIKQVANDYKNDQNSVELLKAIQSLQWVESTNSLFYSGTAAAIAKITQIIKQLDVPQKQVFIEILVIETDVKHGAEFGLEWAAGGKYRDKFGFGVGNFPPGPLSPFARSMQGISGTHPPTGTDQIPIGRGFDLGIIGDIIMHRGKSFLSLGSLVSALQMEGDVTIVLNQKIITQDNKSSSIFVGDNIPFTGSVVETIGPSQQTTANIEYRDVGVSLKITPLLGDGDVITLELAEEITEASPHMLQNSKNVNGIQTTKTNMVTRAHVPDKRFLILSGMSRNTKTRHKSGLPCLGGLPLIGAAFSKTEWDNEKRNVIIFVRPQIIDSIQTYDTITTSQEALFRSQSGSQEAFDEGIDQMRTDGH